jgi:hypothetical protein
LETLKEWGDFKDAFNNDMGTMITIPDPDSALEGRFIGCPV